MVLNDSLTLVVKEAYRLLNKKTLESTFVCNKKHLVELFKKEDSVEIKLLALNDLYSTRTSVNVIKNKDFQGKLRKLESLRDYDSKKFTFNFKSKDKQEDRNLEPRSLISKYLYFSTECKSPIYDGLAIETYSKIFPDKKFKEGMPLKFFFDLVHEISSKFNVSYDELDAFGWLYGKLDRNENNKKREYIPYLGLIQRFKNFKNEADKLIARLGLRS